MDTVIVLGTWSSGSTALTGYIERLGAYSCPPHVKTFDERTPNSHESLEFRNALAQCVDELTLRALRPATEFGAWFGPWLEEKKAVAAAAGHNVIALKHPLAAFMVPQLASQADVMFIVVTRRFASIEATRQRRKWHPTYGAAGAGKVYSALFSGLMESGQSYYTISFEDFLESEAARGTLRAQLPSAISTASTDSAESWLRK